jgi:hypothetical protein
MNGKLAYSIRQLLARRRGFEAICIGGTCHDGYQMSRVQNDA